MYNKNVFLDIIERNTSNLENIYMYRVYIVIEKYI